jgi:hypothetical protein
MEQQQDGQAPDLMKEVLSVPDTLLRGVQQRLEQRRVYLQAQIPIEERLAALQHPQWEIRAAVVHALGQGGTETARDLLLAALHDEHPLVRAAAVRALGRLDPAIPVEQLLLALQDSAWEVREMAVLTLGEIERPATAILQALQHVALHDQYSGVREAASYALQRRSPVTLLVSQSGRESRTPRHVLAALLQAGWRMVLLFWRQRLLLPRSIWYMMPLLMLSWYIAVTLGHADRANASLYLALITVISAAAGSAFLYGAENDPGFELTLATPTSLRRIMLCRFMLVVGYTVMLAAGASALLALSRGGSLWQVVSLWLGPMLLLSSFTLTLSMILGSWLALGISLIIEVTQSFAFNMQNHWITLEPLLASHWQTNPLTLALAIVLTIFALYYAPRRPRLSAL